MHKLLLFFYYSYAYYTRAVPRQRRKGRPVTEYMVGGLQGDAFLFHYYIMAHRRLCIRISSYGISAYTRTHTY